MTIRRRKYEDGEPGVRTLEVPDTVPAVVPKQRYFEKGGLAGPGRSSRKDMPTTKHEVLQYLLDNPNYLKALRGRLVKGTCNKELEKYLWQRYHGLPVEQIQMGVMSVDYSTLTDEELHAFIGYSSRAHQSGSTDSGT